MTNNIIERKYTKTEFNALPCYITIVITTDKENDSKAVKIVSSIHVNKEYVLPTRWKASHFSDYAILKDHDFVKHLNRYR